MKPLTILEAVTNAISAEMERDHRVLVFGEDVGTEGGVFRATAGIRKKFGETRCFDTPLSESGIVGTAIGMLPNIGTDVLLRGSRVSLRLKM